MSRTLIAVLVALPLGALAQSPVKLKPGAWEIATDSDGAIQAEMLAKMPPQMQEVMKQKLAEAAKNRAPLRNCVTGNDEDARRQFLSRMGAGIKCTMTDIKRSGSTYGWNATCIGEAMDPPLTMNSEHTLVYDGGNDYSHTAKTVTKGMPGATDTARVSRSTGRYLGADCKAFGALTMEERIKEAEAKGRIARPVIAPK